MLRAFSITASVIYKRGVGPQSASIREAIPRAGDAFLLLDKLESGILALETECGPVYVRPSGWERIYLLWTFRHFDSLPLKTLNSRQRKLVQRLPRCNGHSLWGRIDRTQVIGTVEGAAVPSVVENPRPVRISEIRFTEIVGNPERSRSRPAKSAKRAPVSVMLAAAGLLTLAGLVPWRSLRQIAATQQMQQMEQMEQAVAPRTVTTAAPKMESSSIPAIRTTFQLAAPEVIAPFAAEVSDVEVSQNLSRTAKVSTTELGIMHAAKITRIPVAVTAQAKGVSPGNAAHLENPAVQRVQFSGPPARMVYPNAPPAGAGKVTLQAVIGPDGKVREVIAMTGDRFLSAAAARAVRQWRYAPMFKDGAPVEAETRVSFLFVSRDVISISFPANAN